jgi:hypothetical protein
MVAVLSAYCVALVGCSEPDGVDDHPSESAGTGCSMTAIAQLAGAAVHGQAPRGNAVATTSGSDCAVFTTRLMVSVEALELPNGTVVAVTSALTPLGTITVTRGAGTMTAELGHFFPVGDTVHVEFAGTQFLSGKIAIR